MYIHKPSHPLAPEAARTDPGSVPCGPEWRDPNRPPRWVLDGRMMGGWDGISHVEKGQCSWENIDRNHRCVHLS